ncbi:hypothetical protein ACJX0J_011664 [Zea mays]
MDILYLHELVPLKKYFGTYAILFLVRIHNSPLYIGYITYQGGGEGQYFYFITFALLFIFISFLKLKRFLLLLDDLSNEAFAAVDCGGLPLALNVIGTAVAGLEGPREWISAANDINIKEPLFLHLNLEGVKETEQD